MIKHLARNHEIHLCCLADNRNDLAYRNQLNEYAASVDVVYRSKEKAQLEALSRLLTRQPLSLGYFYSRALSRMVRKRIEQVDPDLILVYSSSMVQYVPARHLSRVVLDMVDVDSEKWIEYSRYSAKPMSWIYRLEGGRLRRYELQMVQECAHTVLSCQREVEILRGSAALEKISTVFNGVDDRYFDPANVGTKENSKRKNTIVFAGAMDYYPNVNAVTYFVREILPPIRQQMPHAEFHIVGSNPSEEVRRLVRHPGVTVTGYVEDIRPYLASATVFVAPLRIARGIQNKILEAMAMRCAIVTTSQALGNIEASAGKDLLVADHPETFATQVIRLIGDADLNKQMGDNARQLVERRYRWTQRLNRLEDILERSATRTNKIGHANVV